MARRRMPRGKRSPSTSRRYAARRRWWSAATCTTRRTSAAVRILSRAIRNARTSATPCITRSRQTGCRRGSTTSTGRAPGSSPIRKSASTRCLPIPATPSSLPAPVGSGRRTSCSTTWWLLARRCAEPSRRPPPGLKLGAMKALTPHQVEQFRREGYVPKIRAMSVIPGSHRMQQLPHRDTFDKNNLLTRGQEIAVEVDESRAAYLELEPGEASLHHVLLVHGSPPNPSHDRRIGFAIRYIPTSVRQLHGEDSATLVRGVDTFHHFEHEPIPEREMQLEMVALHKKITERNAQILYRGTEIKSYDDPAARGAYR